MRTDKIILEDLLKLGNDDNIKVKLNLYNGSVHPIDEYLRDPDIINNQWLFWRQQKRYFNEGEIAISLVKLSYDRWLLTSIQRVTEELDVKYGINYKGEAIKEYKKYFGRVIVKHHKSYTTGVRRYNTIFDQLEVLKILPTIFDGEDFPGYDNVKLSYPQLENIIKRGKKDWISALRNQKGVYLITDKKNGMLYVGSATSTDDMLLNRWTNYIESGHGGNNHIKPIIDQEGIGYARENFQYSILENYNSTVDSADIRIRESWWKEVLKSKEFGYNGN